MKGAPIAGRQRRRWALRSLVAALALLAIVWIGSDPRLIGAEFHWFHRTVSQAGALAPLLTVLVITLHAVLPYPVTPIIVLATAAMGSATGIAASWIGLMLAAFLGFYLARWLGHPLLTRLVPRRVVDRFSPYVSTLGPVGVFLARVLPLPFAPISLLAGLSPIRPVPYGVATGLGILPGLTVVGLLLGRKAGPWENFVIIGGFVVVLAFAWWAQRRLIRQLPTQEGGGAEPNNRPGDRIEEE